MINEMIENIVEKVNFRKREEFHEFLKKCIYQYYNEKDQHKEAEREYKSIVFKLDLFFKNFGSFINECGKDKKLQSGVVALMAIAEELQIEIEPSEAFVLFHMRDLGKFKIREAKLLDELKSIWGQYKEYKLDDDEFPAVIRALRNERLIDYRKGNMAYNPTIILRYK